MPLRRELGMRWCWFVVVVVVFIGVRACVRAFWRGEVVSGTTGTATFVVRQPVMFYGSSVVALWSHYCGSTVVALRQYCGSTWQYCGSTVFALWSQLWSHCGSTVTVLWQYCGSTVAVLW